MTHDLAKAVYLSDRVIVMASGSERTHHRGEPVGFSHIRLRFELDTDASDDQLAILLKLAERYCVIAQSLRQPPVLSLERGPV